MTGPDWPALRRTLRTGGWEHQARGLLSYLLEQGVPCTREHRGHALRFELDEQGHSRALALTPNGWTLAADERDVHLRIEQVQRLGKDTPPADVALGFRAPRDLVRRADRYVAGTRLSRSQLVALALDKYLRDRGA